MSNHSTNEIIFFTKGDEISYEMDDMIVSQSSTCCGSSKVGIGIDIDYVINNVNFYTHGFVVLGDGDPEDVGSRGLSHLLKAFSIFTCRKEVCDNGKIEGVIRGLAICCNKNHKGWGRKILEETKKIAIANGATRWIINSLPEENLIDYYAKFGFEPVGEKSTKEGVVKTCTMKMFFGEGDDEYDYDYSVEEDEDICFEKPMRSIDDISLRDFKETKVNLYGFDDN